jgi:cleavage and polyadenylation specificity factor subunit 2
VAVESGADGQTFEQVYTGGSDLTYQEAVRAPLEGAELDTYQRFLAQQKQTKDLEGMNEPNIETTGDVPDDAASASSSDSEESGSERQGKALNYSTAAGQAQKQIAGKVAVGVNMLLKEPNMYDYDVRGKKGREAIFPTIVKRKRADEFGEVIRPEDYLRAEERDETDGQELKPGGREQELGQKRKWGDVDLLAQKERQSSGKRRKSDDLTNGAAGEDEADESSDNDEEEESFIPSKLSFKSSTVQVQLRLGFVDFTGLHDQRNMSLLIPLINPRKIVLIGGSASDTSFLANECRQKLMQSDASQSTQVLFTPFNGETVEASMDTNAWTVRLSDALVRQIHWQNVGKLDVMTLAGRLGATASQESEESRVKRQKTIKSEDEPAEEPKSEDLPPTLDVLPANFAGGTRSVAQPLHVGDLRLADLRKILLNEGHSADFRGQGTLVVDGRVAVRKSAGGRIEIESGEGLGGRPDASRHREMPFFAVKKRIYEGLAIIAGR